MFVLLIPFSFAHMDGGQDVVVDGYEIDFGYSPLVPISDASSTLSFNLLDPDSNEPIEYDTLRVRITKESEIHFAGSLEPKFGNVIFSYSFPKEGLYDVLVDFQNEESLVTYTFQVQVDSVDTVSNQVLLFVLVPAVILLFGGLFLLHRTVRKS